MLKPLALLAALFLVLMTAGAAVEPPPLRAAGAPGFDARAAQARLRAIINPQAAHPVDSTAEDIVRAHLMREIAALGLHAEIHEAFACRPSQRVASIECGQVRNIVFSMGPDHGPAVLAAGHYDSVQAGPGVTDDGIGVSVLLELARELSHARLARRVIFLLSDGEELALLGAYEFAQHDPLMHDVEALIELEARGTRGPAVFFESNQPNADAVRAYANVARPVANSIMADIYRLLPNSTDVTVLKRPGLDVINIAVLEGLENYHTPQDSFAAQDLRSLQHMGDEALAIVGAWASAPDRGEQQTLVYTDILSRFFISTPAWLAFAVLALSMLIAFFAFWRSGAESRWRSFAVPIVSLVFSTLLGCAVWAAFEFVLRPGDAYWWAHPELSRAWCIALGLLGAPFAMLALGGKTSAAQVEAGGLFWFAALGALLTLVLPGISILFAPSAAIYALGVLAGFAWKPAQPITAVLAAIVALVIWAPMLALDELALGFQFPFANTALFALAALPWLGALARLQAGARWRAPALALSGAALACIAAAAFAPSATRERPLPLNIGYLYDATTNQGRILASGAQRTLPRELSALQFTPQIVFPGDTDPYWAAPTQAQPLQGPALEDIAITPQQGGARTLHARLRTNGASRIFLRIPRDAAATRVRMSGAQTNFADTGSSADTDDYVALDCQGRACDGAEIEMTLGAAVTDWSIIGIFPGPAASAQAALAARPPTRTTVHLGDNAITLSNTRI